MDSYSKTWVKEKVLGSYGASYEGKVLRNEGYWVERNTEKYWEEGILGRPGCTGLFYEQYWPERVLFGNFGMKGSWDVLGRDNFGWRKVMRNPAMEEHLMEREELSNLEKEIY